MTDLSGVPSTRLFTVFGTVLYVDAASGYLRHGPVESSPANAVFVAEPGWGQSHRHGKLMQEKADHLTPIACLSEHCKTVSNKKNRGNSAAGTLLELVPLERGLMAFTANGLFLTAEPGGKIYLRNQVCSTWECFLASEDWCSFGADDEHLPETPNSKFDTKRIQAHLVHPLIRKRANAKSTAPKVLIFGYTKWSHGRVYYDLCKQLHRRGYIVDIINWRENHSSYFADLIQFYDLFMTALDGVRTLTDVYSVPYGRVIALSHHELDIRMLIEQKGVEIFDKFANYGVVSEYVYCASFMKGITRAPKVVPLGVNFGGFYSEISEHLATVGYAGSMSVKTYGVEWKRGELAEAAAREAGLEFRVAGSTANQISFHEMPDFYRSVDAVLVSSISEAAQLPVMEAAAAGRLVIGTPVGHFPRKAYEGGGILAPVEAGKFKAFTVETLRYYKDNPAAYQDKCHAIQEAARRFDWKYTIDEWVDLIESANAYMHELAHIHQHAGRFAEAAPLFARAAETNTQVENRWHARWQEARCLRELGDEGGFVRASLRAFHERPHRAEPLYDLAQYYITKSRWKLVILYANAGMAIPTPPEEGFGVEEDVYRFGLREAFAIAASYSKDAEERERGRKVCEWLILNRDTPASLRNSARCISAANADSAPDLLPSLVFHQLSIPMPAGLHPINTSICRLGGNFTLVASAGNWIVVDGPREYNWAFLPGQSSCRVELALLEIDPDFRVTSSAHINQPDNMPPPESHEEIGFSDPRLFIWRDALWCVANIRQLNDQSRSEMALARVDRSQKDSCVLADWHVIPSGKPVQWEKNWIPQVDGDDLRLIYSVDPTRVLADSGLELHNEPAPIFAHDFRGGSQAVSFDGGWLMLVHEHQHLNGKRHYFHRFIWMDADNRLRRLSRRFYFRKLGIEFAAGMAWHPDGERLVVSFSVQDSEQYLAVISAADARATLLEVAQIESASLEVADRGKGLLKIIERVEGAIAEVKHENQDFLFVVTNPADAVMQYHHRGSFYEVEELQIIARHFTNGEGFVDIGANVGNHAIYVSRFMAASKIIVFEPNPAAIAILKSNLLLNNCNNVDISYLGVALAAQEGRMRGATPYANNLGHTTYFAEENGEVQALAGDDLLFDEPIGFIKIDVERMEMDILSGLEKTIERWRPIIFVEILDSLTSPFEDWCERAAYQPVERFQRYPGIQNYLIKPSPGTARNGA